MERRTKKMKFFFHFSFFIFIGVQRRYKISLTKGSLCGKIRFTEMVDIVQEHYKSQN